MHTLSKNGTLNRASLILIGAMVVILLLVHYCEPLKDGDIFFHLKYGEYHIQHKTFKVDHSIFSWTPADPHAPYCVWAGDVLLYGLYRLGGWPLLFIFNYVCMFVPVLFVWLFAKQTGMGAYILIPFVLILVQLAVDTAAGIKPEILSLLFFTLIAFVYFQIKKERAGNGKWHLFLLFPPIFILWINTSGVVFLGLIFLAAIICGELVNTLLKSKGALSGKSMTALLISGLSSAAASLLNPYGYVLHQTFYNLVTQRFSAQLTHTNTSYQSLVENITNPLVQHYMQYGMVMILLLAILFFANGKKNRDWDFGLLVPNLYLGILYMTINRTTYYWPAFWAMSIIYLSGKERVFLASMVQNTRPIIKYALFSILIALSLFFPLRAMYYDYYIPKRWSYFGLGFNYLQPVQESAFLKENRIGSKLFNSNNIGSYLIYDLFPHYKVFIDGRYFTYKFTIYDKYRRFMDGSTSLEEMEAEFGFDVAMVDYLSSALDSFLMAKEWKAVFYGIVGVVFVKDHIDLPPGIGKPDVHRFDRLNNLNQTRYILRTAHNLNDLESASYLISLMNEKMDHLKWYEKYHQYFSICQKGLESYAQGDFDKALEYLYVIGFEDRNLRINLILKKLIYDRVKAYVKDKRFEDALNLMIPVYHYYDDQGSVIFDTGIAAYMASKEGHSDHTHNGIRWRELLNRFLGVAPDHPYAHIARQLLENKEVGPLPFAFYYKSKEQNNGRPETQSLK